MADVSLAPATNGVTPPAQDKTADEAPGVKVFAGNLAYSVTDEGLKAFFEPVAGDILSCQVIYRGTRSAGYGFVAVATMEAAQKAVSLLHDKELEGRKVAVEVAKPADQKDKEKSERRAKKRVSRRGDKAVPGEVTEAEANGEVPKPAPVAEGGEGDEAKPKKKKKSPRKKAAKKAKAEAGAPTENGAPVEGGEAHDEEAAAAKKRTPKPKREPRPPRRAVGEEPTGEQSKTTLFVANLSFSLDDEGLAAIFTDAGIKVNSARIVRRRWGAPRRSKGYGFVDVGTEEEQLKAIAALQGKELADGRQIAIKVAVDPEKDEENNNAADEHKTEEATVAA